MGANSLQEMSSTQSPLSRSVSLGNPDWDGSAWKLTAVMLETHRPQAPVYVDFHSWAPPNTPCLQKQPALNSSPLWLASHDGLWQPISTREVRGGRQRPSQGLAPVSTDREAGLNHEGE